MSEQFGVRVVRTKEEIERIRSTWAQWQKDPRADVDFFVHDHCLTPGIVRPHIVVIYRRGQPDAMLVGKIVQGRVSDFSIGPWCFFRPNVRALRVPEGGLLGNVSTENCLILVGEIMKVLREREADLASFSELRIDCPMYDLVTRLPNFMARDPFPDINPHYVVRLPRSIEAFYRELVPEVRWNVKRCARRSRQLEREYSGSVTICCYREPAELDRMMHDVEEVAKKTWQRGLGRGFRNSEAMRRHYALAVRSGWLRGYVMYVAGRPCAFWVGTLYGGAYYADFTGYDPALAKYSPGTCLLIRVFDDLCRNNVSEISFGRGFEEYKHHFANCQWQAACTHIYSLSPKGIGLKALQTVTRGASALMKWTLQQAGFLERLKQAVTKGRGRALSGVGKQELQNLAGQ